MERDAVDVGVARLARGQLGDLEGATGDWTTALHVGCDVPGQERVRQLLAAVTRGGPEPGDADGFLVRGRGRLAAGDAAGAREDFQRAISMAPESGAPWADLSALEINAGRHGEALAAADEALARSPDLGRAHFNRGAALVRLGRPQEALESFERATQANPENGAAWFRLAMVLDRLGQAKRARETARRALRGLAPTSALAVQIERWLAGER